MTHKIIKILFITLIFLGNTLAIRAQEFKDIIVLDDQNYIECTVTKVDKEFVYYTSDNKEDRLPVHRVERILYSDGSEKVLKAKPETAMITVRKEEKVPAQPAIPEEKKTDEIINPVTALQAKRILHEPYNPSFCGLVSLIIPGSGLMLADETKRGWKYLGASYGLIMATTGFSTGGMFAYANREAAITLYTLAAVSAAAYLTVDIMSIVDAVKTAKRKNRIYNEVWEMQNKQ